MECRYRGSAVFTDVVLGVGAGLLLALFVAVPRSEEFHGCASILLLWLALSLGCILPRGILKWRSRLRVDDEGVSYLRWPGRMVRQMRWDEIEELTVLAIDAWDVRGSAGRIRISNRYRDSGRAWERFAEVAHTLIRGRLAREADERGFVTFRARDLSWVSHLLYALTVLGLSWCTLLVLRVLLDGVRHGEDGPMIMGAGVLGIVLWVWRRQLRLRSGWVALGETGLLIHSLDGEVHVEWSEVREVGWDPPGCPVVHLKSRRAITLPRRLGNAGVLVEWLRERGAGEEEPEA